MTTCYLFSLWYISFLPYCQMFFLSVFLYTNHVVKCLSNPVIYFLVNLYRNISMFTIPAMPCYSGVFILQFLETVSVEYRVKK